MGSINGSNKNASTTVKSTLPLTGGTRLREMLEDPSKIIVCPGVFDGLTARLALAAGFDALYMVLFPLLPFKTTRLAPLFPLKRAMC